MNRLAKSNGLEYWPTAAECERNSFRGRHLSDNISMTSGIASRYAAALFELFLESSALDSLEADIAAMRDALAVSEDLRTLIKSPVYSRGDMADAIDAVAEKVGLSALTRNTLALMASKRRLFVVSAMLDCLEDHLDSHRGVVTAEITAAHELSQAELTSLKDALRTAAGQDVRFSVNVDNRLIGGLSARLGSKLVDATIRTKLTNLKSALREVE